MLKYDSPAYRREIERAEAELTKVVTRDKMSRKHQELQSKVKTARERLTYRHEQAASRLFVVDVGLNLDELRQLYPQWNRYAIVHGRVGPWSGFDVTNSAGSVLISSHTDLPRSTFHTSGTRCLTTTAAATNYRR